ncbi:hypothetical protein [Kitasatospora sp. NPDC096140]|uniref:hypothetical protein n=1 Tax=Kitasatospora sp. NPDC096140 TaxID=3155425 RepID=UPI0033261C6F
MTAQPRTPSSRAAAVDVRLVRAVVLATVSVALAAAAHTAAGGRPGTGSLVLGWALTALIGAAGAGRQRSCPTITGAFATGQLGLHLLFRSDPWARLRGRLKPAAGSGGHVHLHHPATMTGGGAMHASAHTAMLGHSPAMLAAHGCAALATGWLLHRVEVTLWRLLDLARALPESARDWRRRCSDTLARLAGRVEPVQLRAVVSTGPVPCADDVSAAPVALRYSRVLRGPPRMVGA